MRIMEVPEELRKKPYIEDGEEIPGDYGKCGGCNWESGTVFLIAKDAADLEKRFNEHHTGLCGECMTRMISDSGWSVDMPE